MPEKLSKYPNFYDICHKNSQNSRILHDFCPKIPEFYIIMAGKIFSPNFGGGALRPTPVSYAHEYDLCATTLRLLLSLRLRFPPLAPRPNLGDAAGWRNRRHLLSIKRLRCCIAQTIYYLFIDCCINMFTSLRRITVTADNCTVRMYS